MSRAEIESYLLSSVAASCRRLTFIDLVRSARRDLRVERAAVAAAVKRLLADGSLAYVQQLGRTFLELSYHHGRKISTRITLIPDTAPRLTDRSAAGIELRLSVGAAFGAGDHPTTRLALQAVDQLFGDGSVGSGARVLDVGTGSGILAIAAVLLGASSGVGLDIDPCALWEAKENARINGVADRLEVLEIPLRELNGYFDLILANLRFPTLVRFAKEFSSLLIPRGKLVVSGFRLQEKEILLPEYEKTGLLPIFENSVQDWMVMVFSRPFTMV